MTSPLKIKIQKCTTIASTPTHNMRLLVSAIVCSCAGEASRSATNRERIILTRKEGSILRGKFIICKEHGIALLLVQMMPSKGIIAGYNQILFNALLCAYFTIFQKAKNEIEEHTIGYNGWITDNKYEDFCESGILKDYMDTNPDTWFCKIIKEQYTNSDNL